MRTSLLHDRAVTLWKAKVNVYTDSLLCLGKFHEHLHSIEARKQKLEWFMKSREYRELDGIDGRTSRVRVENIPRTHNTGDAS